MRQGCEKGSAVRPGGCSSKSMQHKTFLVRRALTAIALPLVWLTTASATGQTFSIEQPNRGAMEKVSAVAFDRTPTALLADHRRMSAALAAMKPGRKGIVDAFVVVAGLDSDAVFGREAFEAGRVLSRRFDAAERTIVLAAGVGEDAVPASPANLAIALAQVGELAGDEDAVVLYTTSHGSAKQGIAFNDRARGRGAISPVRLKAMLDDAGVRNRLIIVSACYSGIFVPRLADDRSVVISAAAADRSSFGCDAGNDWTYWGDALLNRAFRKSQPLAAAFAEARASVAGWEAADKFKSSNPQISVGEDAGKWLEPLEARMPTATTAMVGRSPAGSK